METGAHIATPQVSLKKGLKMFGDAGKAAVRKEMQQIHDMEAVKPVHKKTLTPEQRKEALEYLMFLKRKRSGKVKGRGCADGRKQRSYIPKEEASSPTASTQSIMMTHVIDALEGRSVWYVDLPGAFLQAAIDRLTHVIIRGELVEQMLEVDRELYEPYVTYDPKTGEKILYLELLMALYGTQLTVAWHVDDLKNSHVDDEVLENFVENELKPEFGSKLPLTVSKGPRDEYIGMTFDHSEPGVVEVSMHDYVQMMNDSLPADMIGSSQYPHGQNLFKIRDDNERELLNDADKEVFVRLVMQALYLSQRARPDIRTAVSFLTSRLQHPDRDDYKKLAKLMKYLQANPDIPLRLESDGSGNIYWWVDASYAVHPNMRGHTGATMSLGKGSIYSSSGFQKLVSRSSTETETIAVYDTLPQLLWTTNFLKGQGYQIDDTILYQDNTSAILLETNGRQSSSKRTKHMNVRYFFIKEKVDSKEIKIAYCPTEDMLADFFTKPLTGKLFYKLRDLIMNIDPSSKYHSSAQRSVLSNQEEARSSSADDGQESDSLSRDDVAEEKDVFASYRDALLGKREKK